MQKIEKVCGIYKITCISNGKFYIGSSMNVCNRWLHHLSDLRLGKHHSVYLQRCYNKYGEVSITFSILHRMDEYNENYYIKSRPHKGKGIMFKEIYKTIMQSDLLYAIINDKIFTLPYISRFIQQCISNNT